MSISTSASAAKFPLRGELFAGAIIVLVANSVANKAVQTVGELGFAGAIVNGLGISWAFWLSVAICLRLSLASDDRPARPIDLWVCAASAMAALAPVGPLSSLAATGLGAVLVFDREQDIRLRAAGMVLLAIAVQLLWSRLAMLVFVGPIAAFDAQLVAWIVGTPVHGNTIRFADGTRHMAILAGCTSVQNASVALTLFVAIVRNFRPAPIASEWLYLLGAFLSVLVTNTFRLSLMALSPAMFALVHGPVGATTVNLGITAIGLAWAAASVRHELLA